MKRALLIILCIFAPAATFSQIGPLKNTVIPPSPTSAVYRQFTGATPDLSTGAATLSIPFFEIRVGGYSLPIEFRYYTNGIKVDDSPYPLGYGWIFSPGLRITRTIMGRSDFNYQKDIRQDDSSFDYLKKAIYTEEHGGHHLPDASLVDTQYDFFTINLPSGNYSFCAVKNSSGEYEAVSTNNNLKISFSSRQECITVTDDKGIIYYFGDIPGSSSVTGYRENVNNNHGWTTAWMLRKIELPGQDRKIDFSWSRFTHNGISPGPKLGSDVLMDYKNPLWGHGDDTTPTYNSAQDLGLLVEDYDYPYESHISSISFPLGTVSFSYDRSNNPLIRTATVSNCSGTVVKTARMTYGSGTDVGLLQSISITGEGSYYFYYNPQRFSNYNAQDWWGYYNGKSNNSPVPQLGIRVYPTQYSSASTFNVYGNADRSVDTTAVKANLLTKVEYPTGGYTEYEYEVHQFYVDTVASLVIQPSFKHPLTMGAGVRVRKMTSGTNGDETEIVTSYIYGKDEDGKANVLFAPTPDSFIDEFYAYDYFPEQSVPFLPERGNNFRILYLNPHSDYLQYSMGEPCLWYEQVTEYGSDGSKTVYKFQRPVPANEQHTFQAKDLNQKMTYRYKSLFSKGTLLKETLVYEKKDSEYYLRERVKNHYSYIEEASKKLTGLYVTRKEISIMGNGPDFKFATNGWVETPTSIVQETPLFTYDTCPQFIEFLYEQLDSTTRITYNGADSSSVVESYGYRDYMVNHSSRISSDGHRSSSFTSFPKDSTSASTPAQRSILDKMFKLNMVSVPFRFRDINDGTETISAYDFSDFSGCNLPLPSKLWQRIGNSTERCIEEYDYDSFGNIRTITTNGTNPQTYLWSYNSSYPVMQVSGKTYSQIIQDAGGILVHNLESDSGYQVESLINSLRAALNGYPSINSFTYIPLVGISKTKDSRGMQNSYQYDSQFRLMKVLDRNDRTVLRFGYATSSDDYLSVAFNIESQYFKGSSATFTANASWDNLKYIWTLKDARGQVIYSSGYSENKTCRIPLNSTGSFSLNCTVESIFSGETATYSRSITVVN